MLLTVCVSISRIIFEPHEFCLHILQDNGLGYHLVHSQDLSILPVNDLGNNQLLVDILSASKLLSNANTEDTSKECFSLVLRKSF
jgi:hypothetical protein